MAADFNENPCVLLHVYETMYTEIVIELIFW